MDFINRWPYDIVDLVFQHLSGRQILELMTVSPNWNEHLMRSNTLKKIVLTPNNNKPGLECLLKSQRKYRHLKVVNGTKISREIVEIISNPLNEFNSLNLFRTQLSERKQIEQIFLNTSSTLERLELHYITYESTSTEAADEVLTSYNFPHLKILRIEYHNDTSPWINKFIESFPLLEAITLGNACDEHMKKLILMAVRLKKLTISGRFFDENFYKDLACEFKGKLNEFVFNDILSSSQEDVNLSYFNQFFRSQSDSLCRFETDALLEPEELESAFRMKNLTELYIKGFHYNIGFMDIYLENMRSMELPVAALRTFSVHYMNQHLLEIMAMNAKNLRELKVAQFAVVDVSNPSLFLKLEILKIFFIDSEIKERVQNKPENERSHFEKLIMSAISNLNNSIQPLMLLTVQHL